MEPILLYPSKKKWLLMTLICLAFLAIGAFTLYADGPALLAWAVIIFFGAGIVVSILQLLPNAAWLKLNEDGFAFKAMFRTHSYRWQEIEAFGATTVSGQDMVIFEAGKTGRLADMNRQLTGADQALPDTYGMSAVDLAMLMTRYAKTQETGGLKRQD